MGIQEAVKTAAKAGGDLTTVDTSDQKCSSVVLDDDGTTGKRYKQFATDDGSKQRLTNTNGTYRFDHIMRSATKPKSSQWWWYRAGEGWKPYGKEFTMEIQTKVYLGNASET